MDNKRELTFTAIFIGVIISTVMAAANVYLGLYAGMTVSASIPAAVLGIGIYRGILKRQSILECNIIQTTASAGVSLASGIIFTIPALLLVGAWTEFHFWQTTLIAISGGVLGIVCMIPLRKTLIEDEKELTFPEGVACASVLQAGFGEKAKGAKDVLMGLLFGGVFKFLAGFNIFKGGFESATFLYNRVFFFGMDISPALMAVGYIVNLEVAFLIFLGGVIGWFIAIPLHVVAVGTLTLPTDVAWDLWSSKVRYIGVGAMIVAGLWSIYTVRNGISKSVHEIKKSYRSPPQADRTKKDLGLLPMGILFCLCIGVVFLLYSFLIKSFGLGLLTTIIMIFAAFLFVAVSSYIVGLVGSSNSPVSGMTISALLVSAVFFLVLGYHGQSAILATLGIAAVVCCATCTAGDISQDLKTGYLVGATPSSQQIAMIIGAVIPAFILAPILSLLHAAYGIGTGLKAPQANLFASISKAIFGDGNLPYNMITIGAALGVFVIIADLILKRRGSKIRLHLMPLAVGIYLPFSLGPAILIGGVIRKLLDKKLHSAPEGADNGTLLASGLIAGEAIMGVFIALLIYLKIDSIGFSLPSALSTPLTLSCFAVLAIFLYKRAAK